MKLNKYGELSEDECTSCGSRIEPEWMVCPSCGQAVGKATDSDSIDASGDCRHCGGTGKCDCYECKYKFAIGNMFTHTYWDSSKPMRQEIKKADKWASANSARVVCAVCRGTGT